MDPADIALLPDRQIDHQLRKLLGKQTNVPVWLRNVEYTELPRRQAGLDGVLRTRSRTLVGKPTQEIAEEFLDVGEEGSLEEGIEHSFDLAKSIDKEFALAKTVNERGEAPQRQWLVHPNPTRRTAAPVGVWHLFPHYAMWKTPYVSVNFMDGNLVPAERLAPPGTDFAALPHAQQAELLAANRDHEDSLLLPLEETPRDADAAPVPASSPAAPGAAFTFFTPRVHRSHLGLPDAADDEDQPGWKRAREYERTGDFMVADDIALGRKESVLNRDRELCFMFSDDQAVTNYVKLEDQLHLKRKVRKRGEADPGRGRLYVVDTRPLTAAEARELM